MFFTPITASGSGINVGGALLTIGCMAGVKGYALLGGV